MKRILFCLFLILNTALASAYTIQDYFLSSYQYETQQDYDKAIQYMLAVKRVQPEGYTVNLRLGWLYYVKQDYANSSFHYQLAMKAVPSSMDAKVSATLPLMAQQKWAAAEKILKEALAIHPNEPSANLKLAYVLRMQQKYDEAENVNNKMLAFYPLDAGFLAEQQLTQTAKYPASAYAPLSPWVVNASVYSSSITYTDSSLKTDAQQVGGMLSVGYNAHVLEVALDSVTVTNKTPPELKQYDYTAAYTNYSFESQKFRLGGHYIESTNDATNAGTVIFVGYNYYVPASWNAGFNLYQSSYAKYGTYSIAGQIQGLTEEPALTVMQISPQVGFNFGEGLFYAETVLDVILPSDNPELAEDTYFSGQQSLSAFYNQWATGVYVAGGTQVFGVGQGGFSVSNSADEKTGGYGVYLQYTTAMRLWTMLSADTVLSKDPGTEDTVTTSVYTVKFGYTF
ncbi:MAG: tetratricopeptide repeat protein [SAR324 cluster bacterium]|nr:tetratricopeptide repeat protein [SAR324 cluster bacterium]